MKNMETITFLSVAKIVHQQTLKDEDQTSTILTLSIGTP